MFSKHDDGVVDHEADGQHQRQQRQRVDGEVEGIHQREGADERDRDGNERNESGADRAQKQKDDQHDEQDRLANRLVNVFDRLGDEHRAVVCHADLHALRQRGPNFRQQLLHAIRHFERVCGRLLDDAERYRRLSVEPHHQAFIERAELGMANICEPHEVTVSLFHNKVVELLGRTQIRLRKNGEFTLQAFDAARRHLDILAPERRFHVLRRQIESGQAFRIEPDAHGILSFAEEAHFCHARNRL